MTTKSEKKSKLQRNEFSLCEQVIQKVSYQTTAEVGGRAGERVSLPEKEREPARIVRNLGVGLLNLYLKETPKQSQSFPPSSLLNEILLSKQRLGQNLESSRSLDIVVLQFQKLVISKSCSLKRLTVFHSCSYGGAGIGAAGKC